MSDTYGKSVTLTIFGESHGPAVGATVTFGRIQGRGHGYGADACD